MGPDFPVCSLVGQVITVKDRAFSSSVVYLSFWSGVSSGRGTGTLDGVGASTGVLRGDESCVLDMFRPVDDGMWLFWVLNSLYAGNIRDKQEKRVFPLSRPFSPGYGSEKSANKKEKEFSYRHARRLPCN